MTKSEADRLLSVAIERHRNGEIEAAYNTYRQVLAAHPEHPVALHYLGLVAHHAGHLARAIQLIRRSIRLDSKDPAAHNHLGQILLEQSDVKEAIACFERAVQVDPGHVESLNNLANVVAGAGDKARAIALYRRAMQANPQAFSCVYNLANILRESSHGEAAALFARAVELNPSHAPAHHNLAVLLEREGQFDEAISHYETARRLQPEDGRALGNLLAIHSYQPDSQTVLDAERLARTTGLADDARSKLHHGLAKYYDRQQRFDEAFEHFSAAKATGRKAGGEFNAAALAAFFDRLIETFSADFFASLPHGGLPTERLIFIVGMPRSGTTLIEQILASHPAVFGAGELHEIPHIVRALGATYPECLKRTTAVEIASMARRHLQAIEAVAPSEALRVSDKMPINFMHLGLIATLFPRARVVHCRREPLDVALSCFTERFRLAHDFTTDVESIGRYYLEYERLMAHWRRVLPLGIREQVYEKLISNPEAESRALIEHCGLPWSDACLEFQNTARPIATPSRWQVRQPIYTHSIGRWRNYERHLAPLKRLLEERGVT